ncbi:hypothetical protein CLV78_105179 [Aliiruegeria haliotis]|uniref:Anti-sigma factor NepR domain-containing protein n=2 Tax=Aliiruegeria haliotis TaxID=1280846 RepID=A0A2T0RPS2_9RHOB|nr:hypothetical protein CLV78_105179 [Aliiruegeria haliotis]
MRLFHKTTNFFAAVNTSQGTPLPMPSKSRMLKSQIDDNLRLIFEEESQADLPPRLQELLERLDEIDVPVGVASGVSDPKTEKNS